MGRPLNKKYFGNRNANTAVVGDDGLGGKQVSSVTIGTPGVYTTRATATFSAPDLAGPGGVTATGTVTMEALAVTVNAGGTGYDVGDLITVTGAGGLIARVASVDDDPTEGVVLTLDFTGGSRGEQTVLTGLTTGVATTNNGGGDNGLTVDVTYRVKSVVITNEGSGYTDATDAAVTFSNGAGGAGDKAEGTTVLTSTNEKAIVAYAYVTGNNLIADIKKQVSGRRYKVETSEGTLTCKLVTDGVANAAGEMTITATDANGNTYYVSKLTAHLATLVRLVDDGGDEDWVYATGARAPWSFAAASGSVVQIANK
jgi:hypothetical protein